MGYKEKATRHNGKGWIGCSMVLHEAAGRTGFSKGKPNPFGVSSCRASVAPFALIMETNIQGFEARSASMLTSSTMKSLQKLADSHIEQSVDPLVYFLDNDFAQAVAKYIIDNPDAQIRPFNAQGSWGAEEQLFDPQGLAAVEN